MSTMSTNSPSASPGSDSFSIPSTMFMSPIPKQLHFDASDALNLSVGNLDIAASPKRESKNPEPAGKKEEVNEVTQSATSSPTFVDASIQTEGITKEGATDASVQTDTFDVGLATDVSIQTKDLEEFIPKEISDAKQRLKENIQSIRQMTDEREDLNERISLKTKENDMLSQELLRLIGLEQTKFEEIEEEHDRLAGELVEWEEGTRALKEKFTNVFVGMAAFNEELEEFEATV